MILENDNLKIEFHPALGGKITSFYHKEKKFELAAQTGRKLNELPPASGGFGPYAFGMDDAFPNIDAEHIAWNGRELVYPDHGEIWRAAFEATDRSKDSVSLRWKSPGFAYRYEKMLKLAQNALQIRYRITNESGSRLPCIWTWHGLMRYEEDMEVILPDGVTHCRNVLTGPVLGEAGTVYPLENERYDFTGVPKAATKSMVKFYAEHPVKQGRCGLRYPSQNMTCIMEYDEKILPYFGFWVTAGGLSGDHNCALEPTNGFYDSISAAQKNGKLPVLDTGEGMEFEVKITLVEEDLLFFKKGCKQAGKLLYL